MPGACQLAGRGAGEGRGEQGWRKGLPGVEDGCVLSREGGGTALGRLEKGCLSTAPLPRRGVRDLSPQPGQQGGTAAALLMPRCVRSPSDGPDFAGTCHWAPQGSHVHQAQWQ